MSVATDELLTQTFTNMGFTYNEMMSEEAMDRLKKVVYRNRIRVKEFLQDFDRLRSGHIHCNHFVSGLNIAGLNRYLSPQQVQAILEKYTFNKTDSMKMVDYFSFVEDVERIFTQKHLEKDPLKEVEIVPSELIDPNRFEMSTRNIGDDLEIDAEEVISRVREYCQKRGILVKPFFDDACRNNNSVKLVGHVTPQQFRQALNVKIGIELSEKEMQLLIEKFFNDEYGDIVNYVAFSNMVDPAEGAYDPYRVNVG
eukprot:TRINITY_DN10078_c0_g1_i1.p1 TRINITY_DN10078_c0_g1~~TRINITY_DN10078_c0_g1_i1.p1  ORF type:complete len:254 (-),score=36.53 TRINITY_DN10078_c0_g1_i1:80-841(-)